MAEQDIPDVGETDLTREELEEAAEEVGVDPDGLDDQELLERLGVALGVVDEADLADGATDDDAGGAEGRQDEADTEDGAAEDAAEAEDTGRLAGLRHRVASRLERAAAKVEPDDGPPADPDGVTGRAGGEDEATAEEQPAVGEPIEGPTRDELRERLRALGLPVSGTKDELAARLAEAEREREDRTPDEPEEQPAVGEPIEGPTRDELRERLRALGLPVSCTKDELAARLDEARAEGDDGDAPDAEVDVEGADADEGDGSPGGRDDQRDHGRTGRSRTARLRDAVGDRLVAAGAKVRATDGGAPDAVSSSRSGQGRRRSLPRRAVGELLSRAPKLLRRR